MQILNNGTYTKNVAFIPFEYSSCLFLFKLKKLTSQTLRVNFNPTDSIQ